MSSGKVFAFACSIGVAVLLLIFTRKKKTKNPLGLIKYNETEIIGKGKEGIVYKGKYGEHANAAVKVYKYTSSLTRKKLKCLKERTLKANETLLNFTCANIVKYYTFIEEPTALYICMELCDCNLEDFIRYSHMQDVPKDGFQQILKGLNVLHENKFLHRDLKPSNILVKKEKNTVFFKISDFSLAEECNVNMSISGPYVGTPGWMPPDIHNEVLANLPDITVKASTDIFSCGMIGFFIKSGGKMLFNSQQDIDSNSANYSNLHDRTAEDLVRMMTCSDESQRPSPMMCLEHPCHWDANKTINFFKVVSDTIIGEKKKIKPLSNVLDQNFRQVFKPDWESSLTHLVRVELFKAPRSPNRPRYNNIKVSSLIRAIRNTKDHFHEMSHLHQELGNNETQLLAYWTRKFPQLCIYTYTALKPMVQSYGNLRQYY